MPDEKASKPSSSDDQPAVPETAPVLSNEADQSPAEEQSVTSQEATNEVFDDPATSKAVDDIAAGESDKLLAVDDAARQQAAAPQPTGWKARFKNLFRNKWTWVAIVVLLIVLFGVPPTRYKLLGLVIKKQVTITVLDSKTATPVSNAQVRLGSKSSKTDAYGKLHLKSGVGPHKLAIGKQYYKSSNQTYFVGFKAAKPLKFKLVATGRLVPVSVVNKITGKPVGGVLVKVLNTTAKTNAKGKATIAIPATADTDPAKLSAGGYNSIDTTLQITDQSVKANIFQLTPSGHIYFLSNFTGNIDVVKTNLDGSGRKTVLTGTGREDPNTTSLLASRDWRYLVLKARRDGAQPALYLIDTASDKVTQFDNAFADYSLVGWYGHYFIYNVTRNGLPNWQPGRQIVKSYDADHLQLNQLDQNQAEGDASSYAYQNFYNFYILNGVVVYNTQWSIFNSSGSAYNTTGKNDTIRVIQPNGQNRKDYQQFPANTIGYVQAALYNPAAVYYSIYNNSDGRTTYYEYENQAVKVADIDSGAFNRAYPTFLVSPSGNQTFWTELRDGKNTLFKGDATAKSKQQIAPAGDYAPYGWFSDNYLLASKNASELYILPTTGLDAKQQPFKITNYYKPAQTYSGYGYGYGGL
jgi:hypothetical protein